MAYDLEQILAGLTSPSWTRKAEALRTATAGLSGGELAREAQVRLAPTIIETTRNPKWEVRKAAALALAELEGDAAHQALHDLAADANRWVSEAATRALRRMRTRGQRPKKWPLTEDTEDPTLRHIAARIRQIGLRSLTPALIYDLAMEIGEHAYRQLAADTAHEIRTLLTPFEGYLAELGRHLIARGATDATSDRYLATALARLKQIQLLIDDLQVYSSPGESDFAPVDLAAVVRDAVTIGCARGRAEVRREIDVPQGLVLDALPDRLVRAIANLVANACQAMPEGGTLTVRARLAGDDRVELTVGDTGHGMSPEMIEQARERFRSTRRDEGGTGLGLPIAERIVVHDHRGELAIESAPGQGTTVTIVLPLARPPAEA